MADVVVTVPLRFGWSKWIDEGDPAGEPWSGTWYWFTLGGHPPKIEPGELVYVVHNRRLRGYAPLVSIEPTDRGFALVRGGDAVACTIEEPVPGVRGYRYRWWPKEDELPFPDWRTP